MTKRPGDAACGDTAPRMLLERYWERMLRRIKGSAESIEHTSDSERPRVRLCDAASPMIRPIPSCAEAAEVRSRSSPTSPTSCPPSHASSIISASVRRRRKSHRRPGSGSLCRWTRRGARSKPAETAPSTVTRDLDPLHARGWCLRHRRQGELPAERLTLVALPIGRGPRPRELQATEIVLAYLSSDGRRQARDGPRRHGVPGACSGGSVTTVPSSSRSQVSKARSPSRRRTIRAPRRKPSRPYGEKPVARP
jgi:hypothetical protein